jgi:DnaJ-class molecular chaperone
MIASNLDTNLQGKHVTVSITTKNILERENVKFLYYRTEECECSGDDECKFCEGTKIREAEMSIMVPFHSYIQGTQITVSKGGDIDRYGRMGDLVIDIEYKLHSNMRLVRGIIEYNIAITDVAFGEMLSADKKGLNILIPS